MEGKEGQSSGLGHMNRFGANEFVDGVRGVRGRVQIRVQVEA